MAFTGQENVEDLRYQLARRLYTAVVLNASILKLKDVIKIPDIEKIVLLLKKRSQWSGVRAFLQLFPCFFLVTDESGQTVIKPIVTIEFCRAFDGKRGCGRTFCSKLHVCRHFVKGKCTFGPRCKKPHHFQSGETREVLKKHFLDELNDEQAREFLCRNVQHFLDPESASGELPKSLEICKYYNVATGCTREFCPYIHVCRFFAEEGNCKFGSQCIRKHDINNVHSRILLHRYHMDHLNEPQVMAYLKIKGEQQRDQQQQQQGGSAKTDKPQSNSPPTMLLSQQLGKLNDGIMPSFSLPNGLLNNIHGALANDNSRKLSQPAPGLNGFDDGINTRKLSLPTPPMSHPMLTPRPPVTMEGTPLHMSSSSNTTLSSNLSCPNNGDMRMTPGSRHGSYTSSLDNQLPYFNRASPAVKRPTAVSNASSHNSFNDSFMQIISNNLHQKLTFSTNEKSNGLGLTNLSPPVTAHPTMSDYNVASSLPIQHAAENNSKSSTTNIVFSKSRSLTTTFREDNGFENFPNTTATARDVVVDQNNTRNDMSHSVNACLSYSNSISNQSHSFFTSRVPFMRASSNDIISPTGSMSSINGSSSSHNVNTTSNGSLNGHENDWQENGISKSLSCHDESGDFALSYYRTKSLPNFSTIQQQQQHTTNGDHLQHEKNTTTFDSNCTCQKNEICIFYLRGMCRFPTCLKQHTDETFQWQISLTPIKQQHFISNGYSNNNTSKNEKQQLKTKKQWINIEKNENLKLESAFCSPEIEESEIEHCGDFLTVNFNEMIAIGANSTNDIMTSSSQRSCDLSSWLLQSTDESSTRRNSNEKVVYHIRRVSTRSSVVEEFDLTYATHWLWYWQDSFGIWRKYPTSKAEVIDTSSACFSNDMENRFLEGHEQFIFEDAKVFVDYKLMIQINGLTRKQKKIRRRPKFICKEQRDQFGSLSESFVPLHDVARPWYWSKESSPVNRPYDLVDVSMASDTYTSVLKHITRSMDESSFEVISMKSVQNIQLWAKFISLRNQFEKSHIKYADKFVFKVMSQDNLSGVCQQGFPVCTCKHRRAIMCAEENKFATEAKYATEKINSGSNGRKEDIHYFFCSRVTIPISDVIEENGRLSSGSSSSSSEDENSGKPAVLKEATVRHSHQVYPEFLIVLKFI